MPHSLLSISLFICELKSQYGHFDEQKGQWTYIEMFFSLMSLICSLKAYQKLNSYGYFYFWKRDQFHHKLIYNFEKAESLEQKYWISGSHMKHRAARVFGNEVGDLQESDFRCWYFSETFRHFGSIHEISAGVRKIAVNHGYSGQGLEGIYTGLNSKLQA